MMSYTYSSRRNIPIVDDRLSPSPGGYGTSRGRLSAAASTSHLNRYNRPPPELVIARYEAQQRQHQQRASDGGVGDALQYFENNNQKYVDGSPDRRNAQDSNTVVRHNGYHVSQDSSSNVRADHASAATSQGRDFASHSSLSANFGGMAGDSRAYGGVSGDGGFVITSQRSESVQQPSLNANFGGMAGDSRAYGGVSGDGGFVITSQRSESVQQPVQQPSFDPNLQWLANNMMSYSGVSQNRGPSAAPQGRETLLQSSLNASFGGITNDMQAYGGYGGVSENRRPAAVPQGSNSAQQSPYDANLQWLTNDMRASGGSASADRGSTMASRGFGPAQQPPLNTNFGGMAGDSRTYDRFPANQGPAAASQGRPSVQQPSQQPSLDANLQWFAGDMRSYGGVSQNVGPAVASQGRESVQQSSNNVSFSGKPSDVQTYNGFPANQGPAAASQGRPSVQQPSQQPSLDANLQWFAGDMRSYGGVSQNVGPAVASQGRESVQQSSNNVSFSGKPSDVQTYNGFPANQGPAAASQGRPSVQQPSQQPSLDANLQWFAGDMRSYGGVSQNVGPAVASQGRESVQQSSNNVSFSGKTNGGISESRGPPTVSQGRDSAQQPSFDDNMQWLANDMRSSGGSVSVSADRGWSASTTQGRESVQQPSLIANFDGVNDGGTLTYGGGASANRNFAVTSHGRESEQQSSFSAGFERTAGDIQIPANAGSLLATGDGWQQNEFRRHQVDVADGGMSNGRIVSATATVAGPRDERDFLFKIQRELEEQRESWKTEVDRLSRSTAGVQLSDRTLDLPGGGTSTVGASADGSGFFGGAFGESSAPFNAETSSYVDATDSRRPVFKAFVDVSEYSPDDIQVSIDKLTNRIVVEASAWDDTDACRTFTHRIQLPQFADEAQMRARMNQQGILRIEVPLIFYFPPSERDSERDGQAKAFVYGVRDDPNDPACQLMEILVNTGHDVSARDLRLEVDGDRLIVFADVSSRPGGINKERKVIRRFAMPPTADKDRISSKLGRDGRLSILIPIRKDVGRIQ